MRDARKDEESEAAHLAALDPGLRPPALPKATPCQALCGAPGVVGPPPLSSASQHPLCVVPSQCLDAEREGADGQGPGRAR